MRIAQIAGFLGSGKTTTIIELGKRLRLERGKRVAVIVNEIGEVDVDGKFIRDFGLEAKEIIGGCICCSVRRDLLTTLKILHGEYGPDVILIEPTGIALPSQIKKVTSKLKFASEEFAESAPVITLVDGFRFKELFRDLQHFTRRQIEDADIIAINKIDLMERKFELELLKSALNELNPRAHVLGMSAKTGESIDELVSIVLYGIGQLPAIVEERDLNSKVLSEIGGAGIEMKFESKEYIGDISLKATVSNMLVRIAEVSLEMGSTLIGHIKAHIETPAGSFRASLIDLRQGVSFVGGLKDIVKEGKIAIFATIKDLSDEGIRNIIKTEGRRTLSRANMRFEIEKHEHEVSSSV